MKLLYTLSLVLTLSVLSAQKKPAYKDYFDEGSYMLMEDNMPRALEYFEMAYQLDSSSANINYLLGVCYLSSARQKSKAEHHLQYAVTNISKTYQTDLASEKTAPPLAVFYYGKALHINYKFDEALDQFDDFGKYVSQKNKEWKKMLQREKDAATVAKIMVASPVTIKITNMGDSINSEYPEYSAVLSADERMMIYTTGRPNTTGGMKNELGRYYDDIVVSYKDDQGRWSKPLSLSENVNTIGHEGSINLTPDGQTLIVFKNVPDSKHPEGNGNIYYCTFSGKDWSALQDFGSDVNTEYWESHACLSADGNVLFFTSERPGGYGGKDIYRCVKLPNGKWSKALNMGNAINTEYDEDGAFIHPDGQTFFFASNGHKTMGGYDIMFATLNEENTFSNVTNMGYPINTTDDDLFYVTSPDGKRAYFSSAKEGGFGDGDIYQITMPQFRDTYLALFKGQIIPAEGETLPEGLTIIVTDKQSNEIVGTYRPKIANGAYTTILPPGKDYVFSYQTEDGTEFYAEDVHVSNDMAYQEIRREIGLEPVRMTGKVKVKPKTISDGEVALHDTNAANNTTTQNTKADINKTNSKDVLANNKAIGSKDSKTKKGITKEENVSDSTAAKGIAGNSNPKTGFTDKAAGSGNVRNDKNKSYAPEEFKLGEVQNLPPDEYEFYHRYAHNMIDETAASWINFIGFIVEQSQTREVEVNINSCASKVPTRMNGGNFTLAKLRGQKFENRVKEILTEKGADASKVKFKIKAFVDGPEYIGDAHINRKKYEKYQYVKAKVK